METIDIKKLDIKELKALAWETREQADIILQNLNIIRQEIALRENE